MAMDHYRQILRPRRAQAVIELAVFGSIILYLIGLIISQTTSSSFQQDAQLQVMRLALLSSYESSQLGYAKRNSSSFMILEDRLTTSGGRYGASDRQPYIANGSGTMSKHLFKPIDWSDISNQSEVSVMDVQINGQHFEFKTAKGMTYRIRYFKSPTSSHATISQIHGCAANSNYCSYASGACETLLEDSARPIPPAPNIDDEADARRLNFEFSQWPINGYAPAYVSRVHNDDANFRLPTTCFPGSPPGSTPDGQILRRFDLDRNGSFPDMCCPNPLAYIVWQWDWKDLSDVASEIDTENGVYPSYDITGDLIEDTVYRLEKWPLVDCGGGTTVIGYDADILDGTRGDVNPMANTDLYTPDDAPGLKNDLRIITAQGTGTYMEVNEQNNGSGMGRSTSTVKRHQQDYVERKYVLNNKMIAGGSLCQGYQPLQPSVQACCDSPGCCGTFYPLITCVEFPDCQAHPGDCVKKLFIRSNIPDLRGRLWATDVTP